MAEHLGGNGLKLFSKETYDSVIDTGFKANTEWTGTRSYLYMVSLFADAGDATLVEMGVIRCGYNGNHVTKYPILSKAGNDSMLNRYLISVTVNELGNVSINVENMTSNMRVVLIG